jgi:hypothetical protein
MDTVVALVDQFPVNLSRTPEHRCHCQCIYLAESERRVGEED